MVLEGRWQGLRGMTMSGDTAPPQDNYIYISKGSDHEEKLYRPCSDRDIFTKRTIEDLDMGRECLSGNFNVPSTT
jgi:hypothetical protein